MSGSDKGNDDIREIHLVDNHAGDRIDLGISASMQGRPTDKASSGTEGKAISGKGTQPLGSASAPPQPSDAATSAKPGNQGGTDG